MKQVQLRCLTGSGKWIKHSSKNSNVDISKTSNKDGIILVNYFHSTIKHQPIIKRTIKSISLVPVSIFFFFFGKLSASCKLLSKHLRQSLFAVKSHALSIVLLTSSDGCFLNMKVILWWASYFRLWNNIQNTKVLL